MSKRLIMATIWDQIGGQQVEVRIEYPRIQVRFLETGTSRTGRILPTKLVYHPLGILWENDKGTPEEADLESSVLRIYQEAQLVWAREARGTGYKQNTPHKRPAGA